MVGYGMSERALTVHTVFSVSLLLSICPWLLVFSSVLSSTQLTTQSAYATPQTAIPLLDFELEDQLAQRLGYLQRAPLPTDIEGERWFAKAALLAERVSLKEHFKESGYTPPRGAHVLITRILSGVGEPRYESVSYGDTGFERSPGRFDPASTVKLMATVSALWTARRYGLNGDARVSFRDSDGRYQGTIYELYKDTLHHSSNPNYNRLMLIAGIDDTNERYLTARWGLPTMVIQDRYAKQKRSALRISPEISYRQGMTRGVIPERRSAYYGSYAECGARNCCTLFEIQDVLRRVMLHEELPEAQRFPIDDLDIFRVKSLLLQARNRLGDAPRRALGEGTQVYNNVGRIPGRNLIENAMLIGRDGAKLLVTLSMHLPASFSEAEARRRLGKLASYSVLGALLAPEGPGLQHNTQADLITARMWRHRSDPRRVRIRAASRGARRLAVWFNRHLVTDLKPDTQGIFTLEMMLPRRPDRGVLTLQAWRSTRELSAQRSAIIESGAISSQ